MKRLILIVLVLCFSLLQADWSEDPEFNNHISNLGGDQTIPKIAQNPDGSSYIGWWSNSTGNYNMRLQYIDADGNIVWDENGILVSNHTQMTWLTDWDMTVDHDGNAIMAFNDVREGDEQLDIFGYKISPEGNFVWGDDGINLSNGGFNAAPKVTVAANNNCIFAWAGEETITARSISPDGAQNWETPIIINEPDTSSWPQLMAADNDDSEGNFLMKYFVDSGPYWAPDRFVYIQKYSNNGTPVWDAPAVVSDATGISAWNQIFSWAPDGSGGAVIAWHDDRNSENISRAYVQHITTGGTALFADGIQVGDHGANNQYYPQVIYQPSDENIYVYWKETDASQNNSGIVGQKVNSTGELLYGNVGVTISNIQATGGTIIALRPFGEDVVVTYSTYPWGNYNNEKIFAERVDPDGAIVWDETLIVSDMQTQKMHTDMSDIIYQDNGFIPSDGFIISWGSGSEGIFAQRYNDDGTIGTAGPLLPAPTNLTADEGGLITWISPPGALLYNIYLENTFWADTEETFFQMMGLEFNHYYEIGITAVYNMGESEMVTVGFIYTGYHQYGDIDDNELVEAFDAATCLQYVVGIDPVVAPFPWESWRIAVANVDANEAVEAYDAALILQYVVGIIEIFPAELPVRESAPVARVDIRVNNDHLIFNSEANLFGFALKIDNVENILREPEIAGDDIMMAFNQKNYILALASASEIKGDFLSIPINTQEGELYLDLTLNTEKSTKMISFDSVPIASRLKGNYPNPFNPETRIAFNLSESTQVTLNIYNVRGQLIDNLLDTQLAAGDHQILWNAESQPSGIYYYSLKTEGKVFSGRMVLLK